MLFRYTIEGKKNAGRPPPHPFNAKVLKLVCSVKRDGINPQSPRSKAHLFRFLLPTQPNFKRSHLRSVAAGVCEFIPYCSTWNIVYL